MTIVIEAGVMLIPLRGVKRIVGPEDADRIARANGFQFAEQFVKAHDNETLTLDGDLRIVGDEIGKTITKHIEELRAMVEDKRITIDDHDIIGFVLTRNIGHLIGLSNEAWEKFKSIIDESREVHYARSKG